MQIFIFIICTFCGVVSGIFYDVLYIARSAVCGVRKEAFTVKDKIFTIACDVVYSLVFTAMFIFTSVMFNFYELRLYMLLGSLLGAFLYLKSFHVIVAFFVAKVYNKITLRKLNSPKGRKVNERRKA